MTVLTVDSPIREEPETQKPETNEFKSVEKCRPITATLSHPLVLDVKLLQRLDMTTFTKRGLIALAKFCGISLVTSRNKSKRKSNNKSKRIGQDLKKKSAKEIGREGGTKRSSGESGGKVKHLRLKPRIKLMKIKAGEEEEDETEEDSSDVVCKRHEKPAEEEKLSRGPISEKAKSAKVGPVDGGTSEARLEVVPEPCKSCNRSRQPERLHSHPKSYLNNRMTKGEKRRSPVGNKRGSEEPFGNSLGSAEVEDLENLTKPPLEKSNSRGRNPSAKGSASPQKFHLSVSDGEMNRNSPSLTSLTSRGDSGSPSKSKSSIQLARSSEGPKSSPEPKNNKNSTQSSSIGKTSKAPIGSKKSNGESAEKKKSFPTSPVDEGMKYVTGCYVCGRQMSPKARLSHEKECIKDWRSQNDLLAPKNRKPEPIRPDYRFTGSGDLDYEGTFQSIWANHMDSLVPCKKCGRKFFPDRIERHENCCNNNNSALRIKYKN